MSSRTNSVGSIAGAPVDASETISAAHPLRILMLLENNPYRQDTRVRSEASTLVAAGHRVSVICPRGPESRAMREQVAPGVTLYQYPAPPRGVG